MGSDEAAADRQGFQLSRQGDRAGALEAFRRADEQGHAGGADNLGVMLLEQGDREGALAAFRRADERGDPRGAYNLGRLLLQQGDEDGALGALRRADERGHADGADNLGVLLWRSGDREGALAAFRRADERGHAGGADNLGILLWERGDREGALGPFRRADERGHAGGAYDLGILLLHRGDSLGALAAFRRADERGHAGGANSLGVLLWEQGDSAGALAAYRRADERGQARGADNLGILLRKQGDWEGALAAFRRADERGHAGGAYNLGVLLREQGDSSGALEAFQRALQRGHAHAASDLAALGREQGESRAARVDRRPPAEPVEAVPEPDERSWGTRVRRLWTAPGPMPKRPMLLLVPLCIYMVLLGLAFLALAGYLAWTPFGFATSRGGFSIGRLLVAGVIIWLFTILFALLGGSLAWIARNLWLGEERDTYRISRMGRVGGGFFVLLLIFGIISHPQNMNPLSDPTITAVSELALLAALLLVLVPLVHLPPVQRYVAEVARLRAREELPRAPTLGADGAAAASAAANENPESVRFEPVFSTFFSRIGPHGPLWSTTGADVTVNVEPPLTTGDPGVDPVIEFDTVVECPSCRGSGSGSGKPAVTCPRCDGSGRRAVETVVGTVASSDPCPACYGYGVVPSTPACPSCAGAGRINGSRRLALRFPRGAAVGARLRVAQRGEAGVIGGRAGDLVLRIVGSRA